MYTQIISKNKIWLIKWNVISRNIFKLIFEKKVLPETNKIFEIFEPTTFPIDKSGAFFRIASTDTKSSANEVPKPTIIRPIKKSEIYIFFHNLHLRVECLPPSQLITGLIANKECLWLS